MIAIHCLPSSRFGRARIGFFAPVARSLGSGG
jgi:hypothetical protein